MTKTEEKSHKYAVKTKLLDRFFELYKKGRENGAPQNYIDFFEAQNYVLVEVEKALEAQKNDVKLLRLVQKFERESIWFDWSPSDKRVGELFIKHLKKLTQNEKNTL